MLDNIFRVIITMALIGFIASYALKGLTVLVSIVSLVVSIIMNAVRWIADLPTKGRKEND